MNITWYKIISEFNPLSNYNKLDFQWLKRNDLWECNFQTPFQTPKLNYLSANHISLHNNAYKHVISSYNLITVFVRSMLITWKFFTWVCVGACYLKRATIVFLNSTEVISGGCQTLKTTEWFDQIFIDSKLLIFNIELEVFFLHRQKSNDLQPDTDRTLSSFIGSKNVLWYGLAISFWSVLKLVW